MGAVEASAPTAFWQISHICFNFHRNDAENITKIVISWPEVILSIQFEFPNESLVKDVGKWSKMGELDRSEDQLFLTPCTSSLETWTSFLSLFFHHAKWLLRPPSKWFAFVHYRTRLKALEKESKVRPLKILVGISFKILNGLDTIETRANQLPP